MANADKSVRRIDAVRPAHEAAGDDEWGHHGRGGKPRHAPGAPGDEPHWFASDKAGVGTALTPTTHGTSLCWFTLAQGVLSEVFYSRLDCPCTRDLGLIVVRDGSVVDERDGTRHEVETLGDGVLAYRLTNTDHDGRFRVTKRIVSHPENEAVLQRVRFEALDGDSRDYRAFAHLDPYLGGQGADNDGWLDRHRGVPMLFAERPGYALALACSVPWLRGTAGFVGKSDGRRELLRTRELTEAYDRAEGGNVALTAEVDLAACGGEFTLVLAFGPNPAEAGHRALACLFEDFDSIETAYIRGWSDWQATLRPPADAGGGRDLYRLSAAVLRAHEGKTVPGSLIAGLSIPWGEARGDENPFGAGGYHLVWPRDLAMSAGGLLAAGAAVDARQALGYLRACQVEDGHWPQNMRVSGARYWDGVQLGETALPILLVELLGREGTLDGDAAPEFWPMVRRAAGYIVRKGPSTQEDRWENENGYTPFTLGAAVAALLHAADLADRHGEPIAASYLRETADAWNASIESWLYVKDTELARRVGVDGYYARIIPPELDEDSTPTMEHLRLRARPPKKNGIPVDQVVSPDALALVRFGLRAADDPRILDTIKAVDAETRVETPLGPCWRRYNGDGYGEHPDGSPFTLDREGTVGRAWPLLTGERAHYELLAGRRDEAIRLLRALTAFAGDGGLIPEQVWDADDIPAKGLYCGRPTGSAMPLAWAHAEYLKLRRSLEEGRAFDRPAATVRRYLEQKVGSTRATWRLDHRRTVLSAGETLRLEVDTPARVVWEAGDEDGDFELRDSTLGVHFVDIPTAELPAGTEIEFTFSWQAGERRGSGPFRVTVIDGH